LIANINTNSFKNIHPYNIALGSTEGDSFLNVSGLEDGLSSLKSIKSTKTVVPVHISTLDKMLGLRKIDIIKIDVEGFEEEVMKGASQIIEYNQNIRIIFEHNKNFVNKSYDNGVSYLQSLGFNIYRIVPSSKTPLLRIPNKIGLLTSCNLLAVRGKPNRNHS
jgi:FkbM family methyltransferase